MSNGRYLLALSPALSNADGVFNERIYFFESLPTEGCAGGLVRTLTKRGLKWQPWDTWIRTSAADRGLPRSVLAHRTKAGSTRCSSSFARTTSTERSSSQAHGAGSNIVGLHQDWRRHPGSVLHRFRRLRGTRLRHPTAAGDLRQEEFEPESRTRVPVNRRQLLRARQGTPPTSPPHRRPTSAPGPRAAVLRERTREQRGAGATVRMGEWRHRDLARPGSPTFLPGARLLGNLVRFQKAATRSWPGRGKLPVTKASIQLFDDTDFLMWLATSSPISST